MGDLRQRRFWIGVFSMGIVASAGLPPAAAAEAVRLRLQDENGTALSSPVEACIQTRSAASCDTWEPGSTPNLPGDALSVRIEGEDYGPLQLEAGALRTSSGDLNVSIARKSPLLLEGPEAGPLRVSLFHLASSDFRLPAYRKELKASSERLKVPAGDFVLSLSQPGKAPDLHRISAAKGAPVRIRYRPRAGWSLVLRCVDADRSPVPRAEVVLWDAPGFDTEPKEVARKTCAEGGLALFSGLPVATIAATASAKGFLPGREAGLTASPSTFAFQELTLPRGSQLAATVSRDGRSVASALCLLSEARPATRDPFREIWRGQTDREGRCRSAVLREGIYRLQVSLADHGTVATRWIQAIEGQEMRTDIVLTPAKVRGHVRRGVEGVSGYSVEAFYRSNVRPTSAPLDPSAKSETSEDGSYELTLWDPGDYSLHLRTPEGSLASGRKKVSIAANDETSVDFELGAHSIAGIVVDRENQPIEAAWVVLEGGETMQGVSSSAAGLFRFELTATPPSAKVHATKEGFRDSAVATLPLGGDTAPAVRIVLDRADKLQGRVVSAGGAPVPGALVTTLTTTAEGPEAFRSARAGPDGRFEADLAPDTTIGFASGRGCPLTSFRFDAAAASQPMQVSCASAPANLVLTVRDSEGHPLPYLSVLLRSGTLLIPGSVLRAHLAAVGVPTATDGAGRLALLGIAPGTYEIYSSALTTTGWIATQPERGFLTRVSVGPLETLEAQITVSP